MRSLLLDTHALLWFIDGSPKLSDTARGEITASGNDVYVSVVSLWEMAIKASIGKLTLTGGYAAFVARHVRSPMFRPLDLRREHIEKVAALSFPQADHNDPFDRALIAQALVEDLTLVSKDPHFAAYGVSLVW